MTDPLPNGSDRRLAEPDTLHAVNSAFLEGLTLTQVHRDELLRRGLTAAQIESELYRSLGRDRWKGIKSVQDAGLGRHLPRVPGFHYKPDKCRWSTHCGQGLLIPVRDTGGRIVALKVRLDDPLDGQRYRYLSSRRSSGPGPGSPVHVPIHAPGEHPLVRITEGELKANVATAISGLLTVGLPGVSQFRKVASVLAELHAKTARIAFDADYRTNVAVGKALIGCVGELAKNFDVQIECWDDAHS